MPIRLIEKQSKGKSRYRVRVDIAGQKKETTVTGTFKDAEDKEKEFFQALKKETGCKTFVGSEGKCKLCGKPFKRTKPDHKFCSDKCNHLHKNGIKSIHKKCAVCREPFIPTTDYRQKYCSDNCKKEALKKRRKGKRSIVCRNCGHTFDYYSKNTGRKQCPKCKPFPGKGEEAFKSQGKLALRLHGIFYRWYGASGPSVDFKAKKMAIACWLTDQMRLGRLKADVVRYRLSRLKSCKEDHLFMLVADKGVIQNEIKALQKDSKK